MVVSQYKILLDLVGSVYELEKQGINGYGGNYSFYMEQCELADKALHEDLEEKKKKLHKAKKAERDTME